MNLLSRSSGACGRRVTRHSGPAAASATCCWAKRRLTTTSPPRRPPSRSWRRCPIARSRSGSRSASSGFGIPGSTGVEVEVATFRSDGAYVDGRRPESVVFGSPELDAARRDFTINGMFMDPLSGEVIDYVGGQADLENRILRAIGDPAARLREDKLRSLRAIRLAARFQLQIEPATRAALRAMAGQITGVSAERIAQELRRMLVHSSRVQAMNLALETGLVAAILPPLVPMKGLFQGKPMQPEGDLWDHTMLVLDLLPPDPSFTLAFAALLHDAGKPATRMLHRGRYAFHHHEQAGARIAERLVPLRSSSPMPSASGSPGWSPITSTWERPGSSASRSSSGSWPHPGIEELLALHEADALASFGQSDEVDYCRRYLELAADGSDQSAALDQRPRPGPARPASRAPGSRPCSNSFATLSSRERFTTSARRSSGSTASSQRRNPSS